MLPLTITTVDTQLFNGLVAYVICPGSGGEFTVLKNHEPFITTLKAGTICVQENKEGEQQIFEIEKGLFEVSKEGAVILL